MAPVDKGIGCLGPAVFDVFHILPQFLVEVAIVYNSVGDKCQSRSELVVLSETRPLLGELDCDLQSAFTETEGRDLDESVEVVGKALFDFLALFVGALDLVNANEADYFVCAFLKIVLVGMHDVLGLGFIIFDGHSLGYVVQGVISQLFFSDRLHHFNFKFKITDLTTVLVVTLSDVSDGILVHIVFAFAVILEGIVQPVIAHSVSNYLRIAKVEHAPNVVVYVESNFVIGKLQFKLETPLFNKKE
jgi:hypothetical protein